MPLFCAYNRTKALAEQDYEIGNGATVALKAGDKVKMNISSKIWVPFAMLTGHALETRFEEDDGDYEAKVSIIYKFTYNQSYTLGSATLTKTAQITVDNSTVCFELVTVEQDKIDAVNQRLAEINTCALYEYYEDYVEFVTEVLGEDGMTLISGTGQAKLAFQAKLELMSSYKVSPPSSGSKISNSNNNIALVLMIVISTALISLYFFLDRKRVDKQAV